MKFNRLKLTTFLSATILASCQGYIVANVTIDANFNADIEKFNYVTTGDRVAVKGIINKELFMGDVIPVNKVRQIERAKFPQIKSKVITRENNFAFLRLTGSQGTVIECFIRQVSEKYFIAGGRGRCYFPGTKKIMDMIFAQKRFKFR